MAAPYRDGLSDAALRLLNRLEDREARLLSWGYVDGGFTDGEIREECEELRSACERLGGKCDYEDKQLVDWLRARLLIRFSHTQELWRTRFGETVRLLAHLRQLFPWNQQRWQSAPTLVADYRLMLRSRRYPAREVTEERARHELELRSATERRALNRILTPHGESARQLAKFQVEATKSVREGIRSQVHSATIISAGTGSGKTLAFYIPAFLDLVRTVERDSHFTHTIAIYPRNELLKDQFSEVARIADRLSGLGKRPITVGAYYGDAPYGEPEQFLRNNSAWRTAANGAVICPYLRCPGCGGPLLWRKADRRDGRERLVCDSNCGHGGLDSSRLALTRNAIQTKPPDILFVSTEMLNRNISNTWVRKAFGLDCQTETRPRLMLLDEVHTYAGTSGAQVGLLLRRFRHALGHPIHTVGLSATLASPGPFFAGLVGLDESRVRVIDALSVGEVIEEGRDYSLVLRGDPVSRAMLLSTTVQAVMLLARCVDDPTQLISEGAYPHRVFAFADSLDLVNRLYHILLDAEARYTSTGKPDPRRRPLATIRHPDGHDDLSERDRDGQIWAFCKEMGHELDPAGAEGLTVSRTTSRDSGVDATSRVVVATSSLEVGFDDENVGAVVQHKAPQSPASLLQRRGRAGRKREARPWTVVVLSDFGRDRLAYQAYEQLFDPVLRPAPMPVGNRYVLRMHAVHALLDWLTSRLVGKGISGYVWRALSRPSDNTAEKRFPIAETVRLLHGLLTDPSLRTEFGSYLQRALGVEEREVQHLLWDPPRALITEAVPTLLRLLTTDWQRVTKEGIEPRGEVYRFDHPLPSFISQTLFGSLNLPDVQLVGPGLPEKPPVSMPIEQCLGEFAPGRVSRRYGERKIGESHWIEPPSLTDDGDLPIEGFAPRVTPLGLYQLEDGTEVPCYRPLTYQLRQPDQAVSDLSRASLAWHSQVFSRHASPSEQAPTAPPFAGLIQRAVFHTHAYGAPVTVRRFATGSTATLRRNLNKGGATKVECERPLTISFSAAAEDGDPEPAAIGYEKEVDGVLFVLRPATELHKGLSGPALRAARTDLFRDRFLSDEDLLERARYNPFRLEWLLQVYLSAVVARAVCHQEPLSKAIAWAAKGKDWEAQVRVTLRRIFGILAASEPDEDDEGEDSPTVSEAEDESNRQFVETMELAADPDVRGWIAEHAKVLQQRPGKGWASWLRDRWASTMGHALLRACHTLAGETDDRDLQLDLGGGGRAPDDSEDAPAELRVWITESELGGAGAIERVHEQYLADPRRFYLLAEGALAPSDWEANDRQMRTLLTSLESRPELRAALNETRKATGMGEAHEAHSRLLGRMREAGIVASPSFTRAVYARLLRPGSSDVTDRLVTALAKRWYAEEERLGVEIDIRVMAYVGTQWVLDAAEVPTEYGEILAPAGEEGAQGVLLGLLWPRGAVVRMGDGETWRRYGPVPRTDPELLASALRGKLERVRLDEVDDWRPAVQEILTKEGSVELAAPLTERSRLRQALLDLAAVPLDLGFIRSHPRVGGVSVDGDCLCATLYSREAVV